MGKNPFSIEGKRVLITGASSGIGRTTAIECSSMDAQVIITDRNEEKLLETFNMLKGHNHQYRIADISVNEGIESLVSGLPNLHGVVHSAGIIKRLPLKFINQSNFDELMRVNFFAAALITQKLAKNKLFLPGASIVFYSSVATSFASLGNIMYMASKGAINSFMKGIAFELAQSSIRANAIQPGMIKTALSAQIEDETLQKDLANYPLGRYGKPEEIAWAAIYLLSDASSWMTGSILTIDGGLTLR